MSALGAQPREPVACVRVRVRVLAAASHAHPVRLGPQACVSVGVLSSPTPVITSKLQKQRERDEMTLLLNRNHLPQPPLARSASVSN